MNKLASVIYDYSPKNDDELELKVGDKIEVIGFEEEGKWWRRQREKGRTSFFFLSDSSLICATNKQLSLTAQL